MPPRRNAAAKLVAAVATDAPGDAAAAVSPECVEASSRSSARVGRRVKKLKRQMGDMRQEFLNHFQVELLKIPRKIREMKVEHFGQRGAWRSAQEGRAVGGREGRADAAAPRRRRRDAARRPLGAPASAAALAPARRPAGETSCPSTGRRWPPCPCRRPSSRRRSVRNQPVSRGASGVDGRPVRVRLLAGNVRVKGPKSSCPAPPRTGGAPRRAALGGRRRRAQRQRDARVAPERPDDDGRRMTHLTALQGEMQVRGKTQKWALFCADYDTTHTDQASGCVVA